MVRRIVEEDVTTPSTTVVEGDGSWVGRMIVALVVIALLVVGGIWLVRELGDDGPGSGTRIEDNDVNVNPDGNDGGDNAPSPATS